jgi:nucleoside-diphosphate-sugar epimerase
MLSDDRKRVNSPEWPHTSDLTHHAFARHEFAPMGIAFVTGASGFVGSNLVEHLIARGWRARCLVRKASTVDVLKQAGADLVIGDIDQPEQLRAAMEGVNAVYHVAGLTCALKYDDLLRVNRDGVRNVVAAAASQTNPPPVVVVSSIAAAGPTSRGQIKLESDPATPISEYGETKLAGEKMAMQFAGQVPVTIVRPGVVFGPRDRGLMPLFKTLKLFRFHPVPGRQNPALSYIYVEDLAEILMLAASQGKRVPAHGENGPIGEGIYYAVTSEHPTFAEWGRMARPMVGRPFAPVISIPSPISFFAARCSERLQQLRGKPDMFNRDKIRESQAESWACSPAAIERDLHFVPPKPLVERLQQTIDWYKTNRWL